MARLQTCPRGHHFDGTQADTDPSSQLLTCPICGTQCDEPDHAGSACALASAEVATNNLTALPEPLLQVTEDATGASLGVESSRSPLLTIPGYEFLEKIGQGGMGVVFKARQSSLNRVVALKMILADYCDSAHQLARFQIEAEALASLQHPNIVQVHDVGTYDGNPYFSMEFVDGVSLDNKLAGRAQPPRDAARMVELLARAIHVAHQRGIIHRDLKPINVLLTQDGTPKIVDFGLAKRLEDGDDDRTLPGTIVGTPGYMSPEQALGKSRDIGPATDVHALGTILYEMLCGQQPFRATTALATLENVRTAEPVTPSKLIASVPRDLDVICLKCLQKDPRRRYATAEALADDLRRFLNHEPILARPAGLMERTVKWMQRRPAAAALLVVLLVGTVGAVGAEIWYNVQLRDERDRAEKNFQTAQTERERAEKNFQTALDAVNEMLTVVAEEQLATEPRMEQKRRELLVQAQRFYVKLLQDKRDDPAMRRLVAQGHKRAGDIHRLLGENDKAEASYLSAIALLEALVVEFPTEPEPRQQLADSHVYRGELLRLVNKNEDAAQVYEKALQLQYELIRDFPGRPEFEKDLARTHANRGILFKDINQPAKAKAELDEAVRLMGKLAQAAPGQPLYRQHLARAYLNLIGVLWRTDGFEPALGAADKAVDIFRDLEAKYPQALDYQHELAVSYNNRGNIYGRVRKWTEAEANHRDAMKLFQKLADSFPSVPVYRQELANTHNSLAAVLASSERPDDALAMWKIAETIQGYLAEENTKVPAYRGDLGMTRASLGRMLMIRKEPVEAKKLLLASASDLEHALTTNAEQPDYLGAARFAYVNLAETLVVLGEDEEALERADHLVASFPQHDEGLVLALCFLARCADAAGKQPGDSKERVTVFTAHAVQLVQTAAKTGRTAVLAKVRDDPDFAELRDVAGIAGLLLGKGP